MVLTRRFGALLGALMVPVVALPAVGAPAVAQPADGTLAGLGGRLSALLEAEHTAGMPGVFAEVRDGNAVWKGAAGVADVESRRPARPGFSHRVGSITKTFVATTVLKLVAERRVSLDAPIGKYLPDLVTGERGQKITVRMLLNHTSGVGNYTDLYQDPKAWQELRYTSMPPAELARAGLGMPERFTPGTSWEYSNTNYIIAGLLIERVTGHTVASEVGRRILKPLGMSRTYFPGQEIGIRGPHAEAYVQLADGSLINFTEMNMSWAWAAGELISTPRDLNVFYRALLSGEVLPPGELAEMRRTVTIEAESPDEGGYGLGLFWMRLPCGKVWGHNGGVIGHTTVSLHSPNGDRQVTLGQNMVAFTESDQTAAIAKAQAEFLSLALCGRRDAGAGGSSREAALGPSAPSGAVTDRSITTGPRPLR